MWEHHHHVTTNGVAVWWTDGAWLTKIVARSLPSVNPTAHTPDRWDHNAQITHTIFTDLHHLYKFPRIYSTESEWSVVNVRQKWSTACGDVIMVCPGLYARCALIWYTRSVWSARRIRMIFNLSQPTELYDLGQADHDTFDVCVTTAALVSTYY